MAGSIDKELGTICADQSGELGHWQQYATDPIIDFADSCNESTIWFL